MAISTTEMAAKINKAATNMDRLDQIVNGSDVTDVVVDTGVVPSVAKFFKGVTDEANSVLQDTRDARDAAIAAQGGSEAARDVAVAAAGSVLTFETLDVAVSTDITVEASFIRTAGRTAVGDGGAALYKETVDADYLGPELLRNGALSGQGFWDIDGAGWTFSGGVASKTGANNSSISQGINLEPGAVYRVTYTVSGYVSGMFRAQFQGGTTVNGASRTANGTYTQNMTAVAGNNYFDIVGIGATGSVDNISVRRLQRAGQVITNPGVNQRRWENAEDTVSAAMFSDPVEMLEVTRAKLLVPAGSYEFDRNIVVRDNVLMECENGAVFRPTFEPTGKGRQPALIRFGAGASVSRFAMELVAGINTIRNGVEFGSDSDVSILKVTSVDVNNNRIEARSIDLLSGAVILRGTGIRVGRLVLDNFDRGWSVIDSSDVVIQKVRNTNTAMGGFVRGTRDLHVLSGYTSGMPAQVAIDNLGRGPMTPGLNSLVLAGCSDSSFSNWQTFDILEHAVRVGAADTGGLSVPNHRLTFHNNRHYRPYGCGHKQDDGDANNIRKVTISDLYCEDVGHGNWWNDVDNSAYMNWSKSVAGAYVNSNTVKADDDNDGNKAACAIRNSQDVTITGFMNKRETSGYSYSGVIGLWVEKSANVQVSNVQTEYAQTDGVVVQSGTNSITGVGSDANDISIRGVASKFNARHGVRVFPADNLSVWRDIQILGIDAQSNSGNGVKVEARPNGRSPLVGTRRTRIEGYAYDNAGGNKDIAAALTGSSFVDNVAVA